MVLSSCTGKKGAKKVTVTIFSAHQKRQKRWKKAKKVTVTFFVFSTFPLFCPYSYTARTRDFGWKKW